MSWRLLHNPGAPHETVCSVPDPLAGDGGRFPGGREGASPVWPDPPQRRSIETAAVVLGGPATVVTLACTREPCLTAWPTVAAQHALQGRQSYVAGTPLEPSDVTHDIQRDQQRVIALVFLVMIGGSYSIYRGRRL